MEKPIKRINLLAKKLQLTKDEIAMCLIYIMSHDKTLAWSQTVGHKSKATSKGSMAQSAFNHAKIKQFITDLGGVMAFDSALHLSMRGNPNKDTKRLNSLLAFMLIDPETGIYRLDKIGNIVNYAVDHGLKVDYRDGGNVDRGIDLTDQNAPTENNEANKNLIKFRADMSKAEYLEYLIQEQGRTDSQKDRNAFTLKISEYMAFKNETRDELRPTIYLCDRQSTSYLERLASGAKGTFNK